jgi:hypothetical protein
MVVVHLAAGTMGMLVGLLLFSGHELLWTALFVVLSGSAGILIAGLALAVSSYRSCQEHSRPGARPADSIS